MSTDLASAIPLGVPQDGEFRSFSEWVDKATLWIGGMNTLCVDAKGRACRCGGDFMRARDEGAFPVSYWFGLGSETPEQQRRSARLAERKLRRFG